MGDRLTPLVIVQLGPGRYRVVCSRCGAIPGSRPLRSLAWSLALDHDAIAHPR
jgi:hypothetical protein